jgi:hypothetical protein
MNKLTLENKLPFKFYAVHAEGDKPEARALIDSTDYNGKDWALTFLWGTEDFDKQLGGVKAYPSYFILDEQARPRAMLIGHSDKTVQTLEWLIEEIKKRGS